MSTNDSLPVLVKAHRNGFTLVPDPEAPFETILSYIEQRLEESHEFFQHSEMTLDLRARHLRTDEISLLHRLLIEKSRVKLVELKLGDDLNFILDGAQRPVVPPRTESVTTETDSPVIVRNTCRSGSHTFSHSDCVVLGDVNPGAEIIAIGDVIVFGNLRGLAHAGAAGDRSARIFALSIEPNQLRIADLVATVPPRNSKSVPKRFEIAVIQDNLIEVISM